MERLKRAMSKGYQRIISAFLALVLVIGFLPAFELGANAATWYDILSSYTTEQLNHRLAVGQKVKMQYYYNNEGDPVSARIRAGYLNTTESGGTSPMRSSPGNYVATFGDGVTLDSMPAYCVEHTDSAVQKNAELTIEEFTSDNKALVMGAFANSYKNIPYWIFLDELVVGAGDAYIQAIRPTGGVNQSDDDIYDGWLTEWEYQYASQLAVWTTLGQNGVEGAKNAALQYNGYGNATRDLSHGSGQTVKRPDPSDQASYRVYMALMVILQCANSFVSTYGSDGPPDARTFVKKDLYTFDSHAVYKSGQNIIHPLKEAANNNVDGIKVETINGTEYYTREFVVSSTTSTLATGYGIYVAPYWAADYNSETGWPSSADAWAPGVILVDPKTNVEYTKNGSYGYKVQVEHSTHENEDYEIKVGTGWVTGDDYWAKVKVCIPTEGSNAPKMEDKLYLNVQTTARNYRIYRGVQGSGHTGEQDLIMADPGLAVVRGFGDWEFITDDGGDVEDGVGEIEVLKVDGSGAPLTGAMFRLVGPAVNDTKEITDSSGRYRWTRLEYGTYTLTEVKAPDGYQIREPSSWTVVVSAQNPYPVPIVVQNTNQKFVGIRKLDKQTKAPVGNVTFRFEQIDGTFTTSVTTDYLGYTRLTPTDLPYGTYKVTETGVPSGYVLDSTPQTFYWTGQADVNLVFENARKMGFRIYKLDLDNNEPIPGVWFDVYKDGNYITTVVTNDAGYAVVSGLEAGYYEVREIYVPGNEYIIESRPQGFLLDPYNPAVEPDPVMIAYNRTKPSLIIRKYDEGQQGQLPTPLDGVTFAVYRDAQLIGEYTTPYYYDCVTGESSVTNTPGVIELRNVLPGTYTVEETDVPYGYVLPENNKKEMYVDTDMKKDFEFEFFNSGTAGLRIIKMDAITHERLPGAVFNLKKIGGEYDEDHTTDEFGVIELTAALEANEIEEGAYEVREVRAPKGWMTSTEVTTIWLKKNQTTPFVFTDYRPPRLTLYKYDPANDKYIPGATFKIYKVGEEDNSKMGITDPDGKIIWNENYLDEFFTPGEYFVEEVAVPAGYILDKTPQLVKLYPGVDGKFIFNNALQVDLQIIKIDAMTGERVNGAVFSVRKVGEGDEQFGTVITGAQPMWLPEGLKPNHTHWNDGEAWVERLNPGVYEVTEVSVPEPYLVSEPPDNKQLIEIIENRPASVVFKNYKRPTVTPWKYDMETTDPLPGAEFSISYKDGPVIKQGFTAADGSFVVGYEERLVPGWYTITEIAPPPGYVLANPPSRDVYLLPGQHLDVKFDDLPCPTLTINKIDKVTLEPLAGVRFNVKFAPNINFTGGVIDLGSFTTDEHGQIIMDDNLKEGWYRVTEVSPPPGYVYGGPASQDIFLAGGEDKVLTFENIHKPSIIIKKYDKQSTDPLPGAEFSIRIKDGAVIYEGFTNEAGQIVLTDLEPGYYTITEIEPPPGYLLASPQSRDVLLTAGQPPLEVKFDNIRCPTLTILKLDSITHDPIANVRFKIEFSPEENFTGGIVNLGNRTTGADGRIVLDDNLKAGWYRVTELEPASGYIAKEPMVQEIFLPGGTDKVFEFENIPKSAIVIRKTDGDTNIPVAGATFTVRYLGGTAGTGGTLIKTVVTSANGTATITGLAPGSYVVEEITPAPGYELSNPVTQTAYITDDEQCIVELPFTNLRKGQLILTKYDSKTREPVAGVTFLVTYSDGAVIGPNSGEYTTDETGVVAIGELLKIGSTVTVKEIRCPVDYNMDAPAQSIKIQSNTTHRLTFYDSPKSGIQILKIDATSKDPLKDAKFTIYKMDGSVVGNYTTDGNGLIMIDMLDPGWYKVVETEAPVGYVIDDEAQDFQITNDQYLKIVFENKSLASLQIVKVSAKDGSPLAGATFEVRKQNGEYVGEYSTGADGAVSIPYVVPGWYVVSETKAPEGYALDSAARTVEVKSVTPTVVKFTNGPLSLLQILKVSEKDGAPLIGATFEVRKQNGELVGTYSTGVDGAVNVPNAEPGWYVISETKAPVGYVLDSAAKTVEVKTGTPTIVKFTNGPLSLLQILKVSEKDGAPLLGATFEVRKQNGELVGTYSTEADGAINVPNAEPGWYVVSETKAPTGYILDSAVKTVEVKTGTPTIVKFTNKPMAGIQVKKINSVTRQPIEGVVFSVSEMNGKIVGSYTTGRDGLIFVPDLPSGWYTLTETKTAAGYILDSEPQNFEATWGKNVYIEVENTPQSGLLIVKTDASTGRPLGGVVFDVRRADGQLVTGLIVDRNQPGTEANSPNKTTAANGAITGSYTTDANGMIRINALPAGEYHVTESKALAGYELDTKVHSVTVTQGVVATLQVQNTPKAGLRLLKIDAVTKAPIYNVEFMVFDANNQVVGTYYTDNAGLIDFTGILSAGRYTIRETRAAAGYYRDDIPRTVQFAAGQVTEIRWENTPQRGQIQITKKSGDDNEQNGIAAGTPLEGAIFEIYDYKTGNLVDKVVSGADGRAVSNAIPLGRYLVKEVQAPKWYRLSSDTMDIEIEFATQIIKREFINYAANTGVTIRKTGNLETMSGNEIRYDIKEARNTGSVALTDFYWRDTLPVSAVRLTKIVTGTYNQALKYKVMVTTNKGDVLTIADNLSTTKNNVIDCAPSSLGLRTDEYVTTFTLMFGTVKAGFSIVLNPQIYVKVQPNLPNKYEFANKADIGGKYGTEWIVGNSTWRTSVYAKTPTGTLPRTGY